MADLLWHVWVDLSPALVLGFWSGIIGRDWVTVLPVTGLALLFIHFSECGRVNLSSLF